MTSHVVVITGSTRGIGRGLAEVFLLKGCCVVISGRNCETIDRTFTELSGRFEASSIAGTVCDVTDAAQVQGLWDFAAGRFGRVDIWVNNAGIGLPRCMLWELDPAQIGALADTNYRGALFGCRVAAAGMQRQQSGGAIYNMEGLGSDGMKIRGLTPYGSSKRALAYITDSLARELKGTMVIVGALQPGMMATDLITQQYKCRPEEWKKVERLFNILSDRVETVAPWLVGKMLANRRNGARFKWFTGRKAAWRFASAPLVRRKIYNTGIL